MKLQCTLLGAAAIFILSVNDASAGGWRWNVDTNRNGGADITKEFGGMKDRYVSGDFNGDGKTDFTVVRKGSSTWRWLIDTNHDGAPDGSIDFGSTSATPMPADYDGDGKTDLALVQKSGSSWKWTIRFRNGAPDMTRTFGWVDTDGVGNDRSDRLVPADFDGDGKTDFAVVRKMANHKWRWIIDTNRDGKADIKETFGKADIDGDSDDTSDIPEPYDYTGDGKADFAVRRVVAGKWAWIIDKNGDGTVDMNVQFGKSSDYPFPGDYNGDGWTDFAVVRQADAKWIWFADTDRAGDVDIRVVFGFLDARPFPADYNGDGKTDLAVVRAERTKNLYRLPFAGAQDVKVSYDSYSHEAGGKPDRENFDLVGEPENIGHTVAAAADGVIIAIDDSHTEFCSRAQRKVRGLSPTEDCNDLNNYVWIRHAHGELSKYTHMDQGTVSSLGLKVGDAVAEGDLLGVESDVGAAHGKHVHFEVGIPNDPANPIDSKGFLKGYNLSPKFCGAPGRVIGKGRIYKATPCPKTEPPRRAH